MKRSPFMLAAMVPLLASAGSEATSPAEVERSKLDNATPVSEIIGDNVRTDEGENFGEVEDVVLERDGDVAYLAIEPEAGMYEQAGFEDMPRDEVRRDLDTVDDEGREVTYGPEGVDYEMGAGNDAERDDGTKDGSKEGAEDDNVDPGVDYADAGNVDDRRDEVSLAGPTRFDGDLVTVSVDNVQLDGDSWSVNLDDLRNADAANVAANEHYRASELIGMEVNLQDEDSFGQVEDVLVNADATEAVALVVDNWEGTDKQRRALPVEAEAIDLQNGEVNYSFTKNDLGEDTFDMDEM